MAGGFAWNYLGAGSTFLYLSIPIILAKPGKKTLLPFFPCAEIDTGASQSCDLTQRLLDDKHSVMRIPALFVVVVKAVSAAPVNMPAKTKASKFYQLQPRFYHLNHLV